MIGPWLASEVANTAGAVKAAQRALAASMRSMFTSSIWVSACSWGCVDVMWLALGLSLEADCNLAAKWKILAPAVSAWISQTWSSPAGEVPFPEPQRCTHRHHHICRAWQNISDGVFFQRNACCYFLTVISDNLMESSPNLFWTYVSWTDCWRLIHPPHQDCGILHADLDSTLDLFPKIQNPRGVVECGWMSQHQNTYGVTLSWIMFARLD